MQVIGVGERRYFTGHSTMVLIIRTANGTEIDLPCSVEQVAAVLEHSNMQEMVQRAPQRNPSPPAPAPVHDSFANSMLDDDEVVDDPIRLAPVGGFGVRSEEAEPL